MAKTLFDYPPHSHVGDPATSYEAGDRMVKTGALSRQEREVLKAIKDYLYIHDTFTAKEIASMLSVGRIADYADNYFKVQRRLSGLHRKGLIERTGERRNNCCVWRLKK